MTNVTRWRRPTAKWSGRFGSRSWLLLVAAVSVTFAGAESTYTVSTNDQREVTVDLRQTSSNTHLDLVFNDPDVARVDYVGYSSSATLVATEPSTYAGGTTISISQLRFTSSGVFGTGPITLARQDGSLVNNDVAFIDLPNKVNFSALNWVLAVGNNDLLLHALGSTCSPALAYFGRSNGNQC